jgi:DNA-binding XRE family transcriptional regulator
MKNDRVMKKKNVTTWTDLKDEIYGLKGTVRRDKLDREFKSLKIGLMLRDAREKKHLTQDQLGNIISKKRSYISRIENDSSNMTLKTLYDIVEKGLGGKMSIQINL